ncbi:MAG: hypothetical protein WCV56_07315 [Candidatus Omnitrophota bacterium]
MYDLGAGESPYKSFFLNHVDQYIAVDWAESLHDLKAYILAISINRCRLNPA